MLELAKSADQAAMNRWGTLSGDLNPLHVDPDYAAGTRYGRTIVHGHMTIAWLCEWAIATWGVDWLTRGEIEGLRFRRPLHADVEYRVVATERGADGATPIAVLTPDGAIAVTAVCRLGGAA